MGARFALQPMMLLQVASLCLLWPLVCEAKPDREDYDKINELLGGDGSLPGFNNPGQSVLFKTGNLYSMQLEESVDPDILAELNRSEPSRQPGDSSVSRSDAEKSIAIAKHQLKSNLSKKSKWIKRTFTRALEQFVALEKMTSSSNKKCTKEMNSIVEDNLQCRAFPRRYVDRVVEYYRDLHANLCRPFFVQELKQRKEEFGLDELAYIEEILAVLIHSYLKTAKSGFAVQEEPDSLSISRAVLIFSTIGVYQGREIGNQEHTKCLYNAIKPIINRDIQSKKLSQSGSRINDYVATKIFEKYVVTPCKRLVDAFGPSFELAGKIGSIVPLQESARQRTASTDVDALQSDYYGTWIRYKICGALVKYGAAKMARDAIEQGLYSTE